MHASAQCMCVHIQHRVHIINTYTEIYGHTHTCMQVHHACAYTSGFKCIYVYMYMTVSIHTHA